ncbi:hypothetical protein H9Q13_01410 [Pontibacter sp. JH31]|uniref:Lipoprotein n=1 Tax=Pontibacter aquaedesilientis TaxID=2766980 RepID=A0ABR7XBX4_9BACT|nr:hypothetical protein [Pontibacter aquaedesilientis]MBD1395808.1 hypothetical protein [Pontibacter aquaedesilientis]
MKCKLVLLAIIGFSAFFFTSCQDTMQQDSETAEATLVWSGEYMVDGCGFEVIINDKKYKPENEDDIDESFKVEGQMPVIIEFVRLGEQIDRRCGLSTQSRAMDGIRVVSVKKK